MVRMRGAILVLSTLLLVLMGTTIQRILALDIYPPLRIAAWNVQNLGPTKMGKPEVVAVLVQVMRRYDIVVLLEVSDVSEETPALLQTHLNEGLLDTYNLTLSERVGLASKEQYAFYWKRSRIELDIAKTYQYPDVNDDLIYDPFVAVFSDFHRESPISFALASIHISPTVAVEEIDALVDVYDSIVADIGIENVMILGDLNAGCTYVGSNDWPEIRLRHDSRFTWLISDHIDTTTKVTNCPYDRIVVAGDDLKALLYHNSAGPYYFDQDLGITDQDLVEDVSDHYPVEVLLKGATTSGLEAIAPSTCVSVSLSVMSSDIKWLLKQLTGRQTLSRCQKKQKVVLVKWTEDSMNLVLERLNTLSADYTRIVPSQAVSVLSYKLSQGALEDTSLHGDWQLPSSFDVTLVCDKRTASCTLSVCATTNLN